MMEVRSVQSAYLFLCVFAVLIATAWCAPVVRGESPGGCGVTVSIYGAPTCDDFALACGLEESETDCYNLTLPDGTISARLDCTNEITTWYNSSACTGAVLNDDAGNPLGPSVNTTSSDCIKWNSWYITLQYGPAVCGASARVESEFVTIFNSILSAIYQ